VVVGAGVVLGVPAWRQRGVVNTGAAPAITVLPFENLSGDSASTYFSDGMTEEMLGVLERARVFRVSSRATTFSYKGKHEDPVNVAQKTRADAVLSGSVRRVGDQLRVVAELARGLRRVSSPAYVFMMNEELGCVRPLVDAGDREDRESCRTPADSIDELWVLPSLLDFSHPALVQAGKRLCDDAARPDRVGFADPQVGS